MLTKKSSLPDWPPYVLLPVAGWYAIASEQLAHGAPLDIEKARHVARLAAIGTWRYSQGIYRIAPELMQALLDSPMDGATQRSSPQKFTLHWIHPLIAGGRG